MLKERGLYDNTLLIYTSDHGSHFRTRNGEYKRTCHDGCTHIPLIIHGPGFTGGRTVDDMVSLLDLPATMLAGGGVPVPADLNSRPLQPLASGHNADWDQTVYMQISESQVGRAVRTRRWKYAVSAPEKDGWLDAGADVYQESFQYDLESDPHEHNNLVRDPAYAAVRTEMRSLLLRKMAEAHETPPVIVGADA